MIFAHVSKTEDVKQPCSKAKGDAGGSRYLCRELKYCKNDDAVSD